VAESVKEPVTAAFRTCFEAQLIPAFQNVTQRMFSQISEALNKGGWREGGTNLRGILVSYVESWNR
jgi:hypothetical protein